MLIVYLTILNIKIKTVFIFEVKSIIDPTF